MKLTFKNYVLFFIGLFITSFGVALSVKAGLGTSPVSAVPYSISLTNNFISFGWWLNIWSVGQILVQILLLRRECKVINIILQFFLAFMYGYMTDFSSSLIKSFEITTYKDSFVMMILSCLIIAFGIWLQLKGHVTMLPGEAMNYVISYKLHKSYEVIKIFFDVVYILVAVCICLIFTGKLYAVREGSIIAALLVGVIIKIYGAIWKKFIK